MKILCTICARGGSKGVPNKNIRILNGKPLIAYSIEQALASDLFEHIVLSTDSEDILQVGQSYGAQAWFLRPNELATDSAAKVPVIRHAHLEAEKYFQQHFDVHVDLDATSPLRHVSDIVLSMKMFIDEGADILMTGSPSRKNPYFNMVELHEGCPQLVKALPKRILRRQDAPKVYDLNASIYIWKREALLNSDDLFSDKTSFFCMPELRSIDIDTLADFKIVESLMRHKEEV
ncbi:MAG: flagellar modification protein B [Legionellales bacterium]|nr:flagellar modification protein B [Legionellales bacterium]